MSPAEPTSPEQTASGLRTRLISAAVGIPIVLLAILAGVPGVSALAIAVALVAGYELSQMAKADRNQSAYFVGFALLLTLAGVLQAVDVLSTAYAGMVFVVLATSIIPLFSARRAGRTRPVSALLFQAAIIYGFLLAHAPLLAAEDEGRNWILLAILGTFAVDTGAYFTGSAIGRHKLAPKISPNKTWEGVLGGTAAAIGAIIALGAILDLPVAVWQATLIGLALTFAGVLGDLFESWLKRRADVKDSGRIIPGHGGMLDRIDSLAPNLAVVYWATQLLEL